MLLPYSPSFQILQDLQEHEGAARRLAPQGRGLGGGGPRAGDGQVRGGHGRHGIRQAGITQ